MTPESPVLPEYRELHEMYCRCLEINEAILANRDLKSPVLSTVLGGYGSLANHIAHLIQIIQTEVKMDPALYEIWRTAATAKPKRETL